ncbi:MAG: hypothetical protein RLZZ565_1580, partial [Planctomycetota bacterium]
MTTIAPPPELDTRRPTREWPAAPDHGRASGSFTIDLALGFAGTV